MDFNIELSKYPSAVHKCIYSAARGLVPLEVALPSIADPEMKKSCEDLHGFVTAMYSDMYDNAAEYKLPVMELENFCGGRTVNGAKQKYPAKTKKILSQTRNSDNGYMVTLYMLGKLGMPEGGALVVADSDYKLMEKRVASPVSPIALGARLAALSRIGLICGEGGRFISERYPKMFPALCGLAGKSIKESGFNFFMFNTLDFRNLGAKHKPGLQDYFRPLPSAGRDAAYALHDFAVANKLAPSINTFWKVDYKYKGAQVMCIGSEFENERILDIRIICTYNWDDPALINGRLEKEPPEFQREILRRVWRCDACSTSHLGRFVTVLGKRQRVCGGGVIGFRWHNPSVSEMENIKRIIQLRCDIIDEIKK